VDNTVFDDGELEAEGDTIYEIELPESFSDKAYVVEDDAAELLDASIEDGVLRFSTENLEEATTLKLYDPETDTTLELIVKPEGEPVEATGDVNGDGSVNATDAALVLIAAANIGAGKDSGLSPEAATNADVNGDGSVNATDAAIILQYAAYIGAGNPVITIANFQLSKKKT
jgi:hypothetical protein